MGILKALVLPYISGRDLHDSEFGEPFSEERVTSLSAVFRQTVLDIGILIDHKILHRDIKPANILVRNNALPSKEYPFPPPKQTFIDHDTLWDVHCPIDLVGTPDFMSPEQANLQSHPTNDLYSVGSSFLSKLETLIQKAMGFLFSKASGLVVLNLQRTGNFLPKNLLEILLRHVKQHSTAQARFLAEGFYRALASLVQKAQLRPRNAQEVLRILEGK